jgi:hypothetical protein
LFHFLNFISQVTRLIPDARGTKCNQELEPIVDTKHSHILRVPFMTENGVLRQWVSRFDIYPYLERFAQANISQSSIFFSIYFFNMKFLILAFSLFLFLINRMLLLRSLNTWNANRTSLLGTTVMETWWHL